MASAGGLALATLRELACEPVRQARRAERLREALRQLLAAGEGLAGLAGAEQGGPGGGRRWPRRGCERAMGCGEPLMFPFFGE